jgi:hypothetical protein
MTGAQSNTDAFLLSMIAAHVLCERLTHANLLPNGRPVGQAEALRREPDQRACDVNLRARFVT